MLPAVSDERDVVTVERLIAAPPEPIFELLVHPSRHPEIDGSGTVRQATGADERLEMGSRFGMSMRAGLPYSMVSTVIEYEENRRLAWQTKAPGPAGLFIGGRIWRYELEPVEGGTLVRESWDIRQEPLPGRLVISQMAGQTRQNMAATLERIDKLVAG
jgi:uncharacterized protein YndB with AHSA1/START domain